MIEITPRFALPLDLPRGKGDLEAPEFHLVLEESELSGPALGTLLDPTASGKALFGGLPQSQENPLDGENPSDIAEQGPLALGRAPE
jgi:hypothetical protein